MEAFEVSLITGDAVYFNFDVGAAVDRDVFVEVIHLNGRDFAQYIQAIGGGFLQALGNTIDSPVIAFGDRHLVTLYHDFLEVEEGGFHLQNTQAVY
ncbi:MAG: hypothetical protein BWY72_02053 [Bacteroidetes bacterium ADurb.Bin416]|nr:MAG: hypothetical protein BWY72_02053 [Bacteroidetes bacterium ADurb.Bin416]